jgi:hypothetical protein
VTWAATSVPDIRRQWCNALAATIDRHSESLHQLPSADDATTDPTSLQSIKNKVADAITWVQEEADALSSAPMYWVARDMVGLSLAAAKTLPSWTPAEAAPAPSGLLCWARPAGVVPYGDPATAAATVAWDAVCWRTRPDGIMQIQLASRFVNKSTLVAGPPVTTPLWAASAVYLDPRRPRTEEASGVEDMRPYISVLGAAWLLMGQRNITETRYTESAHATRSQHGDLNAAGDPSRDPSSVTIIELRRNLSMSNDSHAGRSDRKYRGRWMVGWPNGYWRQQRYGPGGSLRKPMLIAPHTAGPKGAPLIPKERVYVWRR